VAHVEVSPGAKHNGDDQMTHCVKGDDQMTHCMKGNDQMTHCVKTGTRWINREWLCDLCQSWTCHCWLQLM